MQRSAAVSQPALATSGEGDHRAFAGELVMHTLEQAQAGLREWHAPPAKRAEKLRGKSPSRSTRRSQDQAPRTHPTGRTLDLASLTALDTAGALFLHDLSEHGVALTGAREEHRALIGLIAGLDHEPLPALSAVPRWRQMITQLGRTAEEGARDAFDVVTFLGHAAHATVAALLRPGNLKLASISRQVAETGINALPIVALLAVMISVVIAYQGVAQLRPYGSENLTINLVAVSVLREMAVLVTAIIVAGRSGSAFTAEIGVMQAREEIDALKVMGMEPMALLVVPRVIGLAITLPLLTFFADVTGLLGGAVVSQWLLNVTPLQFLDRVKDAVDAGDLFVGLVKAPVFAVVIAVVGCMHGLRVRSSAESVGKETTRAVVKAIFLVIVLDALFSVLFERLGI
jgi:phospholipid/cholesterol/gamma-HCH transport system permease protein